jgi:tetratricopeptide (TPR) repeat protein
MNSESTTQDTSITLSFHERVDILFNEIELAARWNRPSILFAIYKSEAIRQKACQDLSDKLRDIGQEAYVIKTNENDPFDFLSLVSRHPNLTKTVLYIDGFTWECRSQGIGALEEFNKHREYFIDNNIRAIFWLVENEVCEFAATATECWNIRHRVVEFMDIPSQEENPPSPEAFLGSSVELKNAPAGEVSMISLDQAKADGTDNESRANASLRLGVLFWRSGKLTRSLKYLNEAVKRSARSGNQTLQAHCQNALALVYTEMGKVDQAISAYEAALELTPDSGSLWSNLGLLLARKQRNDEALLAFKKALEYSPQDMITWDGIGQIHLARGDFREAIPAFTRALEITPDFGLSLAGLGKAHLVTGQVELAEPALRKAVEINPTSWQAWKDLGVCLGRQAREMDAIGALNKATELNPQHTATWEELGKIQLKGQLFAEAIPSLQKAASMDPHHKETLVRLAYALYQIGDFEGSAAFYEKGILQFEDKKTLADLWMRLGDAYKQMKNYEKAINAYERSNLIKKEYAPTPDGESESSEILPPNENEQQETERQETGEASAEPERGEIMNEANQPYDMKTATEWNAAGNVHLRRGAFDEAIIAYTKAIELAPGTSWPYIQNLAQVHYQKGKAMGKSNTAEPHDSEVWESDESSEQLASLAAGGFSGSVPNDEQPHLEKGASSQTTSFPFKVDSDYATEPSIIDGKENDQVLEEKNTIQPAVGGSAGEELPDASLRTGKAGDLTGKVLQYSSHVGDNSPQNSIDWNDLGNKYAIARKYEPAIEAYKRAIEMNPKFGQPYSNLAFIYYRLGKFDVAVVLYKKSLEMLETQEDKALSWNRLGDAYRRLGDYGNSLSAYQHASEISPAVSSMTSRAGATMAQNMATG